MEGASLLWGHVSSEDGKSDNEEAWGRRRESGGSRLQEAKALGRIKGWWGGEGHIRKSPANMFDEVRLLHQGCSKPSCPVPRRLELSGTNMYLAAARAKHPIEGGVVCIAISGMHKIVNIKGNPSIMCLQCGAYLTQQLDAHNA
jgi:hypothetical protein